MWKMNMQSLEDTRSFLEDWCAVFALYVMLVS